MPKKDYYRSSSQAAAKTAANKQVATSRQKAAVAKQRAKPAYKPSGTTALNSLTKATGLRKPLKPAPMKPKKVKRKGSGLGQRSTKEVSIFDS